LAGGGSKSWRGFLGEDWDLLIVEGVTGKGDNVQLDIYLGGDRESADSYKHYLLDPSVLEDGRYRKYVV